MYKDSNYLESVAKFHKTFGQPILDTPSIPNKDRCELRVKLIQEELNELKDGINNKDIVEIADALADLQYVLTGTILEFGLSDKFRDLFDEVQRSNMSKTCRNEQIAHDTVENYRGQNIVTYKEEAEDDLWLVKRAGDNKVLKSIEYSPADLKPILDKEYISSNELDKIFYVKVEDDRAYTLIPSDHPAVLMYNERLRQIEEKGYTFEKYDQYYKNHELEGASIAYLASAGNREEFAKSAWPWTKESFKPTADNPNRDIIKAGALAMAAYDYNKKTKEDGTQS